MATPYHHGTGTFSGSIGSTKPAPQRQQRQRYEGGLFLPFFSTCCAPSVSAQTIPKSAGLFLFGFFGFLLNNPTAAQ
jgi:hypothetical protein